MAIGWNWSGTRRFAIGVKDGGIKYQNGNSGWLTILSSVSTNTWYNVIITSDSNQYNAYLDGNKIAAASGTGSTPASTVGYGLNLGRFGSNAGYWDGSIDQVRIYNKALSADNVATLYAETVATASTNPTFNVPSCIAYYEMSDATDQTGSYDGTPTNVNFNVAGKFGNAGEFNGSSSLITTGITNSVIPINSDFTISAWVKIQSTGGFVFAEGNWNAWSTAGFGVQVVSSNRLEVSLANNGTSGGTQVITSALTANTWIHMAATIDIGNSLKIYINGVEVDSASLSTNSRNNVSGGFYIGSTVSGYYYDGSIDQVRIFNRAITANEVETLYDEVQCIPTIVPTNNFNVNTYVGNGATQTIDAKFNEAANFNGTSSYISLPSIAPFNDSDDIKCISAWIKPSTSTSLVNIYSFSSTSNSKYYFTFNWDNNNSRIQVRAQNGATSSRMSAETTITPTTDWVHVVAQLGASSVEVYVNGVPKTLTFSNTGSATNTSWISYPSYGTGEGRIGLYRITSPIGSYGSIDQVRIFNTALTGPQVADLYTNETDATAQLLDFPVGAGCVAAYQLDGNADDISGLYSGTPTDVGYTGMQFQPDLVWIKERANSGIDSHRLFDSIRGATKRLYSNSTSQESVAATSLTSFDSNGFSLGSEAGVNGNNSTYVAWNWKAGGAPTATNSAGAGNVPTAGSVKIDGADSTTALAGTIAATSISANTEAGFSVVKYTANATSGATIGHGLDQELDLLIVKSTNLGQAWNVYVKDVTDTSSKYLRLNESFSIADLITGNPRFIPNNFTDSVFSVGNDNSTNGISGTDTYIAYCFHSVSGMSNIGSYVGTGVAGNTIVTGFRPAFVMWKAAIRPSGGGSWYMYDNKRTTSNPQGQCLQANESLQEFDGTSVFNMEFNSNGFTINATNNEINQSGSTYIFLAFAEEGVVPLTRNAIDPFGDGNELALYKFEDNATNSEDSVTASASNVTYATGYIDKAAVFNNSSSEIVAPNSLLPSSGGFAISWWQKTTQADNTYSYTMDNSGGSAQNGIYIITHRTDVGFIVGFKNGSIFQPSIPYSSAERTQWTHFCVSWDGTTSANAFKIYKNNVPTSFTSSVTNGGGSYPFKIGRSHVGTNWFGGSIDQVRIFDRALDTGEVTQLYNE